jgi:uncharacterized membrane protein
MIEFISRYLGVWAVVGLVIVLASSLAGLFGLTLYWLSVGNEIGALFGALLTVCVYAAVTSFLRR